MRFTALSALFVGLGFLGGCGSSDTPPPANNADAGPTDGGADTKPAGDGGAVSPVDISGALTITARVVTLDDKGTKVPMGAFPARIENPAGGWIDGQTGSDGVVTFKVDAAKGPFDLTVAKAKHGVISVLGLTGPAGDIITYDLEDAAASPTTNVTGTITGKTNAANRVQVDAWAFSTVINAGAMYMSKASVDPDLPFSAAALEIDSADKVVNGVITAPQTRSSSPITANIAFPSPANVPTTKTLNVKFPAAGPVAGKLTTVSKPTTDTYVGNVLVVKSNKFAQMFVGVGKASNPSANASTIALQTFAGDLAADTVVAAFSGGEYYARANIKDLADGATTTFGDIKTLDLSGGTLEALTFATEATGYEYSEVEIIDSNEGGGVYWRCIQNGPKIASRKLPHLPAATKLSEVADGAMPVPIIVLFHRTGASATPWGDNTSYNHVVSYSLPDPIDATGR